MLPYTPEYAKASERQDQLRYLDDDNAKRQLLAVCKTQAGMNAGSDRSVWFARRFSPGKFMLMIVSPHEVILTPSPVTRQISTCKTVVCSWTGFLMSFSMQETLLVKNFYVSLVYKTEPNLHHILLRKHLALSRIRI